MLQRLALHSVGIAALLVVVMPLSALAQEGTALRPPAPPTAELFGVEGVPDPEVVAADEAAVSTLFGTLDAAPATDDIPEPLTQPAASVVVPETSEEVVSADAVAEQSGLDWWLIGVIALGVVALIGVLWLARRTYSPRLAFSGTLVVLGLVGAGVYVLAQVRPQASTVSGSSVSLVRAADGTYRCDVTQAGSVSASTASTEALKAGISQANQALKRTGGLRARLRANVNQARQTGLTLARRKAQLLDLAKTDPAAAKEAVLSGSDRSGLELYGNCVETPVVFSGTVETRVAEQFGSDREEIQVDEFQTLTTSDGERLALRAASSLGAGQQEVQGFQLDNEVIITATDERKNGLWGTGPSPMAAVGSGAQKTLVLPVNFTGADGQPLPLPTAYPAERVGELIFGEIAEYYTEVSNGRLSITGDVAPWLTLAHNPLQSGSGSFDVLAGVFEDYVITEALKQGVAVRNYDKLVIYAPNTWHGVTYYIGDGYGTLGDADHFVDPDGDGVVENVALGVANLWEVGAAWSTPGRVKFLVAHELGHALGAHHANLYGCHDMQTACAPVDDSGVLLDTSLEYGNRLGLMGNQILYYDQGELLDDPAALKDMRGWYAEEDIQEIRTSGEYVVRPLEGTSAAGPIALRIPRDRSDASHGYLYLEYRQDSRITMLYPELGRGAILNFTNDSMFHSHLLATDPAAAIEHRETGNMTFSRAVLSPETAPFVDEETGITVDVLAVDANGLRVAVSLAESAIEPVPVRVVAPEDDATADTVPPLQFTVDMNGTFFLKYLVQIRRDDGVTLVYDQRESQAGWTGQNQSGAYYPRQTATFAPPDLPPGNYTWQVKAIATHTTEDNAPFVREGEFTDPRAFAVRSPAYFLFQVEAPHGQASSVVAQLISGDAVRQAREAIASGQSTLFPAGTLRKTPTPQNPTWSWSWDPATLDIRAASDSSCHGDPVALEANVASWTTTEFCPVDLRVVQELGSQLPTKSHELTLSQMEWKLVEVPGANMRLVGDAATALAGNTLYVFVFDSAVGTYRRVTDPNYTFRTGEGYMVLSTTQRTLRFEGEQTYADTLHLKRGWNMVTVPGDTDMAVASVYTKKHGYLSPLDAVRRRAVYASVYTEDYSGGSYRYLPTMFPGFADTATYRNKALWVFAYEEAVLQFKAK